MARSKTDAFAALVLAAVPAAMFMLPANAQNQQASGVVSGDRNASSDTDSRPYDKHDFSGLWSRNPSTFEQRACPECGDHGPAPGYGFFGTPPPRTPDGEKKFQLNKPGRGWELKDAAKHMNVDEGYRRAVPPAFGNDPEARCEPLGLPRLITFSGGGATMEMVQVKDRIIQRFEWTWDNREIWMDGRKLPNVDDYLPRYNGYSVGRWEADTLVVTSTGFDDRAWLDQYGFPISEKAVLEERWDRISGGRLRVRLKLTDSLMYTKAWESEPKIWALIPKDKMSVSGWSGILEDRCVPSDEIYFNQFRDKAAGKQ